MEFSVRECVSMQCADVDSVHDRGHCYVRETAMHCAQCVGLGASYRGEYDPVSRRQHDPVLLLSRASKELS